MLKLTNHNFKLALMPLNQILINLKINLKLWLVSFKNLLNEHNYINDKMEYFWHSVFFYKKYERQTNYVFFWRALHHFKCQSSSKYVFQSYFVRKSTLTWFHLWCIAPLKKAGANHMAYWTIVKARALVRTNADQVRFE